MAKKSRQKREEEYIKGGYSQRNQSTALPIPLFICELNSVKVLQQPCMTDESRGSSTVQTSGTVKEEPFPD